MPFTESGLVPDFLINPHAIPSRMTVGQLIEALATKVSALTGSIIDGTTFDPISVEDLSNKLEALGFNRNGFEKMYSGQTGEAIDVLVFIGPTYYQRLQKNVLDGIYSITSGPTCADTRQPVGGKAQRGGLRVGEMEKDVLAAQGCSRMLIDKFQDASDGFTVYYCRNCHNQAIVNIKKKDGRTVYKCKTCKDAADIVSVYSCFASNLLMSEIRSMGVDISVQTKPYTFYDRQNPSENYPESKD